MKRTYLAAIISLALIPIAFFVSGLLFSAINPDMAAGHPDYVRNYRLLDSIKHAVLLGGFLGSLFLWLATCFYLLKSKGHSYLWMTLAVLGPLGFAAMAMLNDKQPAPSSAYQKFVSRLGSLLRAGYELALFVGVWSLAFEGVILKQNLTALWEAHRRGLSLSQIVQERDASSGMWAFSEGLEVMYLVALIYLLWPVVVEAAVWAWRRVRR